MDHDGTRRKVAWAVARTDVSWIMLLVPWIMHMSVLSTRWVTAQRLQRQTRKQTLRARVIPQDVVAEACLACGENSML
jgi:hypothetical protein